MKKNQGKYTLDWSPKYAEVAKSGELGYTPGGITVWAFEIIVSVIKPKSIILRVCIFSS